MVTYIILGEAFACLGVASSTITKEGVCLKSDLLMLFSTSNSVTLSAKPSDTLLILNLEAGETPIAKGVETDMIRF